MSDVRQSRRFFTLAALGTAATLVNPSLKPHGQSTLWRQANAQYLEAASLALTAISMFSRGGDSGLGAYLKNIKLLSEENIRLTREVLQRVAELQASMTMLPQEMRRVFIEVQGYQVATRTQEIVNELLLVEANVKANGRLQTSDRARCERIIEVCGTLSGARAAPYGVGGTAASCIAMIGAVDARARWFLGKHDEYRRWVRIAYLPWFDDILSNKEASLWSVFLEEGQALLAMAKTALTELPEPLRTAMSAPWEAVTQRAAGSPSSQVSLACGTYAQAVGTRRGECVRQYCELRGPGRTPSGGGIGDVVEAARLSEEEVMTVMSLRPASAGMVAVPADKRDCFCTSYATEPVYTSAYAQAIVGTLRNAPDAVGTPRIGFKSAWGAASVEQCPAVIKAAPAPIEQMAAAIHTQMKPMTDALDVFEKRVLANYNAQLGLVFVTHGLLIATRAARRTFEDVAA